MSKAFSIHVRVSRQQKEVIESNAKANGYGNVSDYLRTRGLCFLICEERLNKIYRRLYPEELHKITINGANKKLLEFI